MQRVAWIVVLFAAASPAIGADLFRCIDPAGAVTWQDAPCGAGSRLTRTLDVPAAPEATGPPGASRNAKVAQSKRNQANSNATGRSSPGAGAAKRDGRTRQREGCKAAREERDRKLEALGLSRTFEQLRTLDDKVQAACKGL